jgi:hypothetical protein
LSLRHVQSSVTSSFLDPHIFLNALFSDTLSLFSSFNVTNFHAHKNSQNYNASCFSLFIFLIANLRTQGSGRNGSLPYVPSALNDVTNAVSICSELFGNIWMLKYIQNWL